MSRRKLRYPNSPAIEADQLRLRISDGPYRIFHCDSFEWLDAADSCSIEAVVTDPPYGVVEYSEEQLHKRKTGKGGIWRIPPSFDGCQRSPLPRFTVLTGKDRKSTRLNSSH